MITKYTAAATLLCAALLAPMAATAVPAYPGLMKVTQPDGTSLTVKLRGDETHHIYLTEDDYLLENRDGYFYYADVDASGNMVGSEYRAKAPRLRGTAEREYLSRVNMPKALNAMTLKAVEANELKASVAAMASPVFSVSARDDEDYQGYGLFPNSSFPVKGQPKGLVVLVEYQDVKFHDGYDAHDYFTRMCNEEGFSTNGGTGSARDFFLENSGGKFDISFDVYGPVTLPKNQAYYGGNGPGGSDKNPAEMVIDALNILDDEVDFSQYDCDGDGVIDNVFVFYAGMGEATGGGPNTVWPHQYHVTYAGFRNYYDGVMADRYACSNEWETMNGEPRPDGVGTFIHEFSHVMGLPDLYATSYTSAFTPGAWSCMDYGPYNNEGRTPPLYGAFERNALGWMKPEEITGPLNATLPSIGNNKAYIINTNRAQEFFLIENRQQVSWDTYVPGEGMLAWHILYNASVWSSNRVNNDPKLQYVDIEEADGTQTDSSRKNDAFPGTNGKFTEFTDDSRPSMMTWQKKRVEKPLTKITLTDGLITFKACGGVPDIAATEALSTSDITPGGFTAAWAPSDATDKDVAYMLSIYTKDKKGNRHYAAGHRKQLVEATSVTVDDLEPLTEYFWCVQVYDRGADEESFESNELTATTLTPTFSYLRPGILPATEVSGDSFTANWEAVEGATGYLVDVFTKTLGEVETYECGFDEFVSPSYDLPSGWSTNVTQSYTSVSYSGKSKPAARLQKDGDFVQSCECPTYVRRLSFWHRGITENKVNYIRLWVEVNGEWQEADSIGISYDKKGSTVTIDYLPDFTQAVRLEYKRMTTGTLALDDIKLECAESYQTTPVGNYTSYDAGNSLSVRIEGLSTGVTYFYTVRATDGTLTTRRSYEGKVTTSGENAIETVTLDEMTEISLSGRVLTAVAPVSVYDLFGRQIAALRAGGNMTLAPGVYIVRGESTAAKIIVR